MRDPGRAPTRDPGIFAALGAALLFGAGTPLAKLLLGSVSPWLMAGLLYLGAGVGLEIYRRARRMPRVQLPPADRRWFAGAVVLGGVAGPLLLMLGLAAMPASAASLLLNAESVFTTLLAWCVFREHFSRRTALGMAAIAIGAVALQWPAGASLPGAQILSVGPALVLGACLAWALDNNFTRKLALTDATWIASRKGLIAGVVNLALAWAVGAPPPPALHVAGALLMGFFAYGVSLALFVVGLRRLGTARTGAYFSVAPFFGALLALALGEPATQALLLSAALMALGVWLHLNERHAHGHAHAIIEHEHEHVHDAHHDHTHAAPVPPGTRHSHPHQHTPLWHAHAHYPDAHHRHEHS